MGHPLLRTTLPAAVRLLTGGALPRLQIETSRVAAEIYFHGAHVARWHPSHADDPVLWLSRHSRFAANAAIRGGVPICFPWFGPHRTDPQAPSHGLARIADWTLVDAAELPDGEVTLAFALAGTDQTWRAWPHAFDITLRVSIGATLGMTLAVANPGSEPIAFEEALHTYFTVGDVERVSISGLEHTDYLDKVERLARKRQGNDPIAFTGETDRVYLDTTATCVLSDPVLRRRIVVGKSGSRTTVVWNPWRNKARTLPDFGDDEWRRMACVETANTGEAAVRLRPGERHSMSVDIRVGSVEDG